MSASIRKREMARNVSLWCSSLPQEPHGLTLVGSAGVILECERITKSRAFDRFTRSFVMTRHLRSDRQVRATVDEKLQHGQTRIAPLRRRMKDRRLPADTSLIECRAGIDVRSTIQK